MTDLYPLIYSFLISILLFLSILIFFRPAMQKYAAATLGSLCISVFVFDALASTIWISSARQLATVAVIEILVLATCIALIARAPLALTIRALAAFALINGGFGAINAYAIRGTFVDPAENGQEISKGPDLSDGGTYPGNVYHIVLDAFVGPYVQYLIEQNRNPGLDGYTYFSNAASQYGRTNLSMRSVFHGQLYSEDFEAWSEAAFTEGMTKTMRESGVSLAYFPFYSYYCDPNAIVCNSTIDIYNKRDEKASIYFLVDTIFLRSIPASLRAVLSGSLGNDRPDVERWDYAFSLSDWLQKTLSATERAQADWPIQSFTMETLHEFERQEADWPASGRYTYLHFMLPHGPFAFDGDCSFIGTDAAKAKDPRRALEDQSDCSLAVLRRVGDLLKSLGRYDTSLIVVHSDHGLGWPRICSWWNDGFSFDPKVPTLDRDTTKPSDISTQQAACEASVLLMVKFPGQTAFKTELENRQLLDVAPTILEYFGLHDPKMEGVSLYRKPPESRTVYFFGSMTDHLSEIRELGMFGYADQNWTFVKTIPVNGRKQQD
ncbi:hypothetical protein [Nitratireductor sp. StC3]|uniref:hypothetical protein n=1 Tax=Nitratireductor sp. StC3 TaxID=2126741 RepID=UPI001304C235|nr:hypothetical protein [Nitratireductor sp. StC3]